MIITKAKRCIVLLAKEGGSSPLVVGVHHVSVGAPTWVVSSRGATKGWLWVQLENVRFFFFF